MNALQISKLGMYRTIEAVGGENADAVETIAAVQAAFEEFKAIIAEILLTEQKKSAATGGVTAAKIALKEKMCRKTSVLAGVVYAYGVTVKSHTLMAQVNFSFTSIFRMSTSQSAMLCQSILNKTVELLAELADYGITQAKIDEWQAAIDAYKAAAHRPRGAIVDRQVCNDFLVKHFKRADALLHDRLDKLIPALADTHPAFVSLYQNAREIIDPPTTATQLKGVVSNKTNAAPVENASVTIVELEKAFKTKPTGRYLFKPIPNGKYTVQVSAEGFEDFQAESVEVKQGKINKLNVELVGE